MKKQNKTKNGVGYFVNVNVGDLEEITRKGRNRRIRKEVLLCVQDMVVKKRFLVKFKDGQKKEISSFSVFYLGSKDEVEME